MSGKWHWGIGYDPAAQMLTRDGRPLLDLFGKSPSYTVKGKGYAGRPGAGPEGETCGGCTHCYTKVMRSGKRFHKCAEANRVTAGPGTDIRLSMPACEKFVGRPEGKSMDEREAAW